MANWQAFLSTYGSIITGFFAVSGAVIGILSSYASFQAAEKSRADLTRATQVIERLEAVIGERWEPLDGEQVEKLRVAIAALPFKATIQVMYLNTLGKAFAQTIATAFRAAQWDVKFSTGGGFEDGVEYGRGPRSVALGNALASVVDKSLLRNLGPEEQDLGFFFIGVGARPSKKD